MASEAETIYEIMVMGGGEVRGLKAADVLSLSDELNTVVKDALTKHLETKAPGIELEVATMIEEGSPDLTDEQIARIKENSKKDRLDMDERILNDRMNKVHKQFDIANKWADRTDLTPREIVHGAIWNIHKEEDDKKQKNYESQAEKLREKGQEPGYYEEMRRDETYAPLYAKAYDERMHVKINAGDIMSAKDLFN